MRIFFLIILIAGIGLGIGYPWIAKSYDDYEIGTYHVFDQAAGFTEVNATLSPAEAPVHVEMAMKALGALPKPGGAVLTLTVSDGQETVLAKALDFADVTPKLTNPQTGERSYSAEAGTFTPQNTTSYIFKVARGDAAAPQIESVDIVLHAGALDLEPRAIPIGYVLIAIGMIGFVVTYRRRPPHDASGGRSPRRWGR